MPWKSSWVKCRICGDEHMSVYPENILDECRQECAKCGHMTCEPSEGPESAADEEKGQLT